MSRFDPQQVSVLIDGVLIDDWADGSDVIDAKNATDAGAYTIGANGTGVFVANPDQSGTVALKIKQHSANNKYLAGRLAQQRQSLKAFTPMTLEIRDLLNEDVVTAVNGYFTVVPSYTRGNGHNPEVWTIAFEKLDIKLERGLGN
jgi:hypothetical protein